MRRRARAGHLARRSKRGDTSAMRVPTPTIQAAVRQRLDLLLGIVAERLRELNAPALPEPELGYYDDRLAAGQAIPPTHRGEPGTLKLNTVYLEEELAPMLEETIAHELAHLVVFHLHPRRRPPPHGRPWQAIMREWFGVEPECTHTFSTDRVRARRQRRWRYACGCGHHWLTTVRHRRIMQGVRYCCRSCQGALRPAHDSG